MFTGLEVTDNRIFLAIPRLWSGVPATLAVIPRHTPPGSSPQLEAYPTWGFHGVGRGQNDSCAGLASVYRIRKDSCNRLWVGALECFANIFSSTVGFQVLDSGVNLALEDFQRICPPKLVIFDLATDQAVRTVIFPRQVLRPNSLLTNLVIDETVQGNCDHAFVYMSDTAAPGTDLITDLFQFLFFLFRVGSLRRRSRYSLEARPPFHVPRPKFLRLHCTRRALHPHGWGCRSHPVPKTCHLVLPTACYQQVTYTVLPTLPL